MESEFPILLEMMFDFCFNHCHPQSASHRGVLSNWESGRSRTGSDLGNRVGATIPEIDSLSKPLWQPEFCKHVHHIEVTACV